MKKYLCLLPLVVVMACGKSRGLESLGLAKTPVTEAETPSDIDVTESLTPVPHRPGAYRYRLDWKGAEKYTHVTLTKRIENESAEEKSVDNKFSDVELKSGQVVEYRITGDWDGGQYLLYQNKFQVPLDLAVKASTPLTTSFKSPRGRIFFEKDAVLKTAGLPIKIVVDSILIDGDAAIDTVENPDAPAGIRGAHGGKVWIEAAQVTGNLKILARGQKGGAGIPGNSGSGGSRGGNGRDAWHRCTQDPGARATGGQMGGMGGAGAPGGVGFAGGDSALVRVRVGQVSGRITIERAAGAGGDGGAGGSGGRGGDGGKGGTHGPATSHPDCRGGPDGPRGYDGPAGPQGLAGPGGNLLPYCLMIGSVEEGQCQETPEKLFEGL